MSRKKIYRLWREEGLRVPPRCAKWALDFQFDTTTDGRVLKLLHVVDEHTREALAIAVECCIDADRTVSVLDLIVSACDASPELVRMDDGPELTANALGDWCRFGGSGACYIEPGSPLGEPVRGILGRHSAMRCSPWKPLTRCSRRKPDRRLKNTYNTIRPHSSLDWKPRRADRAQPEGSPTERRERVHASATHLSSPVYRGPPASPSACSRPRPRGLDGGRRYPHPRGD